jgi:hypothetical protein
MSQIVIGLGHKRRSGKDTLADIFVEKYGFTKIAMADPLKRAVAEMFGLSHEQVYGDLKEVVDPYWNALLFERYQEPITPRFLLQYVGTDLFRNQIHADIHAEATFRKIKNNPGTNYVICDIRFPNEADITQDRGSLVARVDRDVVRDKPADKHASEIALDGYTGWDWIVDNNSTLDDLAIAADDIYQACLNGEF